MSKAKNSNKSGKAANVATQTTTTEPTTIVAAQDTQTAPETTPDAAQEPTPAEFPHMDNFPTLSDGLKFEVNGYKVTITGKQYLREEKYPFTAWTAEVTTPDGNEKTFAKVRNTAIMNFCKATTGITHNGEKAITRVLTDEELGSECTRRAAQIKGLLDRAAELYTKYTGSQLIEPGELFTDDHRAAIMDRLKADNDQRKESAEKAKAANAERTARKQTRDLQKEIADLIAAGKFAEAAQLMQQKADATQAAAEAQTETDAPAE